MLRVAWWYYSLILTCSYTTFHLVTLTFQGNRSTVSNSFKWKFYAFMQLLSVSSGSWIHHLFWWSQIFKGDFKWCISSFGKKLTCWHFLGHQYSKILQTVHDYNFAWDLHCHSAFDDLDLFQGHKSVRNIKSKLRILDSCPQLFKRCMVATYIRKINTIWFMRLWCVFKGVN